MLLHSLLRWGWPPLQSGHLPPGAGPSLTRPSSLEARPLQSPLRHRWSQARRAAQSSQVELVGAAALLGATAVGVSWAALAVGLRAVVVQGPRVMAVSAWAEAARRGPPTARALQAPVGPLGPGAGAFLRAPPLSIRRKKHRVKKSPSRCWPRVREAPVPCEGLCPRGCLGSTSRAAGALSPQDTQEQHQSRAQSLASAEDMAKLPSGHPKKPAGTLCPTQGHSCAQRRSPKQHPAGLQHPHVQIPLCAYATEVSQVTNQSPAPAALRVG